MTKNKLIAVAFGLLFIALLIIGVLIGKIWTDNNRNKVTSNSLVDRIQDQNFLVSKTVIIDQKSKIVIDQGSAWSNFFWGQTIDAEAQIRVDVGIDFSKLKSEDIQVDEKTKHIIINLPNAQILDASQYGDIDVRSSKGVFKFLLDNNPNEDHNQALEQLISDASRSLDGSKIYAEARTDAVRYLEVVVKNLGYTIEVKQKENSD